MLIAPRLSAVHCFVRRNGQNSATGYDGVSAPPNEAGGGKSARCKHVALCGKEVLHLLNNLLEFLRTSPWQRRQKFQFRTRLFSANFQHWSFSLLVCALCLWGANLGRLLTAGCGERAR